MSSCLRQYQETVSAREAYDGKDALMPFLWRIFHRCQSGSIIMDTRIHDSASPEWRQSTPTSSLQEHANLYPVPPAEGENWSMRPVSTSMDAISVLKCLASIPSSMAPPHVEGFRMVVIYLSRGVLRPVSDGYVVLEKARRTPKLLRCMFPYLPGCHRRRLSGYPSCSISPGESLFGHLLCRIFCAFVMSCSKMSAIDENRQELSSGTTWFKGRYSVEIDKEMIGSTYSVHKHA